MVKVFMKFINTLCLVLLKLILVGIVCWIFGPTIIFKIKNLCLGTYSSLGASEVFASLIMNIVAWGWITWSILMMD